MVVLIIKLLSFPTASRYCYRFSRPFSRRVLDLYRPSLWQSCKLAAACRARLLRAYFGLSSSPRRCTPIWSDGGLKLLECLWESGRYDSVGSPPAWSILCPSAARWTWQTSRSSARVLPDPSTFCSWSYRREWSWSTRSKCRWSRRWCRGSILWSQSTKWGL